MKSQNNSRAVRRSFRPTIRAASMPMITVAILCLGPLAANSSAQQAGPRRMTPGESLGALKARVAEEAGHIDRVEVSPLFGAIIAPPADAEFLPRDDQVQLCRDLEILARDVVRAWLLQAVDADSPLRVEEIEGRLGDRGRMLREVIFAQAEAIVLQGILTPDQVQLWHEKSKTQPSARPNLSRNVKPGPPPPRSETIETLSQRLRVTAASLGRGGRVFPYTLGSLGFDQTYPNFDALDPAEQSELMKGRSSPIMTASPKQTALLRRLDDLTRRIIALWLTRGLDDRPPPSRVILAERWRNFSPTAEDLYARADVFAAQGILSSEQVDRMMGDLWRQAGTVALLDPILASRLNLTRAQREQIGKMISTKTREIRRLGAAIARAQPVTDDNPESIAIRIAQDQEIETNKDQADGMIWDVLTPSQLKVMKRLVAPAADSTKKRPLKK